MRHPELLRSERNHEFEKRFNRTFLSHLMFLLPAFIVAGVTYLQFGVISLPAVSIASAVTAVLIVAIGFGVRREVRRGMRAEGLFEPDEVEPPLL